MEKIPQRIKKSYEAYLRFRQEWSEKHYGLDRQLTIDEYNDAHKKISHKQKSEGKKKAHIAREIASAERTFNFKESIAIFRRIKEAEKYSDIDKEALKAFRKKYKSAAQLRQLQLSEEEMAYNEAARKQYYIDRGIEPEFTIQASARQKIFNELLDIGLSYREADEVMYG